MRIRRLLAAAGSAGAVAACAAVAVAMTGSPVNRPAAVDEPLPSMVAPVSTIARASNVPTLRAAASSSTPTPSPTTSTATSSAPAPRPAATSSSSRAPQLPPSAPASRPPSSPPAPVRGGSLPLGYSTGDATRVITVTASSSSSTTATLQLWTKAPGGGWLRYGGAVLAHVGAQGIGAASESRSATPAGTFTLTLAFGALGNPGTPLPYFQTNAADWWISQAGSLYNTHQHCSGSCPFTQGSPNEHLYYETPYYNYAVVIDYNTRNAPGGVRPGAGSAFFLHVTDGHATAGCVAIPQSTLVAIMRWLAPSTHPRMLIGVT